MKFNEFPSSDWGLSKDRATFLILMLCVEPVRDAAFDMPPPGVLEFPRGGVTLTDFVAVLLGMFSQMVATIPGIPPSLTWWLVKHDVCSGQQYVKAAYAQLLSLRQGRHGRWGRGRGPVVDAVAAMAVNSVSALSRDL
eukprot:366015-Chlamydomonas_euryale.AAC.4